METAYAQALYDAVMKGTDPKKAVSALRDRLVRESRLALMPRIARAFTRIAERDTSRSGARVYVAREHDAKAAFTASGVNEADVIVDETLIGGWRLETADTLVDASYKRHLLNLFNRVTA